MGEQLPPASAEAPPLEHFLTTPQAAAILGVSPRTLEDLRWKGASPRYLRLSRNCVRYLYRDLLAWAEERARFNTTHEPAREGST
jgi:predicted DNA-binding transcriptional regulator AlpA